MFQAELLKISEGSSEPAGFVHFYLVFRSLPWAEPDFSGHVDVPCGQKPVIDILIKGLFAAQNGVHMVCTDMMQRLSIL